MTHSKSTTRKWPRTKTFFVYASGLAILAVCCMFFLSATGTNVLFGSADQNSSLQTEPVIEAPFEYTLNVKGIVNSRRFANLESEVNGFTTVLWLIPAGTQVYEPLRSEVYGTVTSVRHPTRNQSIVVVTSEDGVEHEYHYEKQLESSEVIVTPGDEVRRREILAGDVVCRLDASELEPREKDFEILVHDYKANFDAARQDVEIQRALNENNNAKAALNVELTELDFKKYVEGTFPQEAQKLNGEIEQAREDLKRAEDVYDYTQRVAAKGYKNEDEVEQARLKVMQLQYALDGKEMSLQTLSTYDRDRTYLELSEKAKNAKREQERIRLVGEAAMAQARKILASRERVYNIYRERLENIRDEIAACTVVAPQAGQVVFATEGWRTPEPTQVGQRVRQRQDLIHLPDLSDMKVDAGIHESLISYIHEGLPALVTIDSLPGEVFETRISKLSTVPVPGRWPNYNQKEYLAEFKIELPENCEHQLRPGMTANVEVLVEQISEPVIQVPMQSVVQAGEHRFVWVAAAEGVQRREIEVGLSNDQTFIVNDGVLPGERVVSNPLDQFADEIAELRERYAEEQPPLWEPQEIAETEEELIPESEEEFLEMIGFYDENEADEPAKEQKTKAASLSAVGD